MADNDARGNNNSEAYKVDIQAMLNEKGFDRPQKDILNENSELKNQIFLLQNKIDNMREMIEKYTIRTDDITSDASTNAKQLKKIDELVDEVNIEKEETKNKKEKIVELQ
jgi:virulence-associated protein VapD